MKEGEIFHECPRCGDQCEISHGYGVDNDYIFCECGFEQELETSTDFEE